ncbi:MAG: DNA topoisomerase IB, partial [Solirubrobacterales bacterium]
TEENETYGLATLRKKHLRLENGSAVFDYSAKGSKRHVREVTDAKVLPVLRALKRRRGGGHELLAFRDGRGWVDVSSLDVNAYLKEVAGGDFSAKDFRTWNATVLAAAALAARQAIDPPASHSARKRAVNEAVKQVASYLSNTPAVCRRSYIDPRVIDRFQSGETISIKGLGRELEPDRQRSRTRLEKRVLELLA